MLHQALIYPKRDNFWRFYRTGLEPDAQGNESWGDRNSGGRLITEARTCDGDGEDYVIRKDPETGKCASDRLLSNVLIMRHSQDSIIGHVSVNK